MSDNFNRYSLYYDLLYADKDYSSEVRYVRTLIDEYAKMPVSSLLEFGCGTGIHACAFAAQGLNFLGVDLSVEMLEGARARAAIEGLGVERLSFDLGDARKFRVARKFDVVASLFHVLSYQTTEVDLQDMIQTTACHLDTGGLFIFDFWYGPAVLWQRPSVRTKRLSSSEVEVTRLAEPVIHDESNVVDVNYSVFVKELSSNQTHEINETHRMRYLFFPELDRLLNANGFDRMHAEEWLTRKAPSLDSWGVCVVARKR
jgi:SAM-dependent methyltransferase